MSITMHMDNLLNETSYNYIVCFFSSNYAFIFFLIQRYNVKSERVVEDKDDMPSPDNVDIESSTEFPTLKASLVQEVERIVEKKGHKPKTGGKEVKIFLTNPLSPMMMKSLLNGQVIQTMFFSVFKPII